MAQTNVNMPGVYSLGSVMNGIIYRITLTEPDARTNSVTQIVVMIKQDATGSRTLAFTASGGRTLKWDTGTTPTVCSGANEESIYQFFSVEGGSVWYGAQDWKECP